MKSKLCTPYQPYPPPSPCFCSSSASHPKIKILPPDADDKKKTNIQTEGQREIYRQTETDRQKDRGKESFIFPLWSVLATYCLTNGLFLFSKNSSYFLQKLQLT